MTNAYRKIGMSLLFCCVILWFLIRAERIDRYKSAIPEKIKIDRTVLVGGEGTPLIFVLFPSVVRASSCGGAIFKLSQSTIDAIESEGLSFFEDATRSRRKKSEGKKPGEKEAERKEAGYSWQETPVPDTWTSNGAWPGLACISRGNKNKLIRQITKASELPGSYYTGTAKNSNFATLVLPKLGLVIHNRYDL
ncbi:MAG: hypothetical protein AAGE84_05470 [Cyanobacteria bacterium P01_G01_bin.39]